MNWYRFLILLIIPMMLVTQSRAQVTYLDADATAGTGNTTPAGAFAAAQGVDNLWGLRAFGNNGTIYQSTPFDVNGEDAPEIVTTITGLTPGEDYDVWINFWDVNVVGGGDIWCIRAGFTSGNLDLYAASNDLPTTSPHASLLVGAIPSELALTELNYDVFPLVSEANRALRAGYIGMQTADGSGNIQVFVDDLPSLGATDPSLVRTWYDGVSFALAGTNVDPTSQTLGTYVDADPTAGTGNTGPDSAFAAGQGVDNLWGFRALGNQGSIYQSTPFGATGEDAPEIVTTITGLTPSESYEVWVNFWDVNGAENPSIWCIRAGFESGNLDLFAAESDLPTTGPQAGVLAGAIPAENASTAITYESFPLFAEADRTLYSGYIGVAEADGSGNIDVYIDDLPSINATTSPSDVRSWYDGLSYRQFVPITANYVDADATAGTGNTVPDSAFAASQGIDNLWGLRAFGNEATIYQSTPSGTVGEDAPEISTTITGLEPGEDYDIWVNFWDATSAGGDTNVWCIRAGFTSGNLMLFAPVDDLPTTASFAAAFSSAIAAESSETLNYGVAPLINEANRTLYAGYVGRTAANGSGEIVVFIDDLPSLGTSDSGETRTWYDGLTYEKGTAAVNAVKHWTMY